MSRIRYLFIVIGCLLISLGLSENVLAQSNSIRFSVSFKDKNLHYILDHISSHTDYTVSYSNEVRNFMEKLTVSFDEVTAERAVQEILQHTPFTYNVIGKVIKVFRLKANQSGGYKVKGVVKDVAGLSVPNATIRLKGLKQGTIADLDGEFELTTPTASGEIVVSNIGMETQTVKYIAGQNLSIVMTEALNQLGEVAVIAYGKRTRHDLVGSISSLKGEELKDLPTASLENLLQGKMAGVGVSNLSGQPGGGGSQVVIRGFASLNATGTNDGSPLYVIDGVPVQSSASLLTGGINPLSSLDPSSIESVEVLKDAASASLYGSRAGNGVVLITTKKGKSGRAEFNVNVSQSISWLPETPLQVRGNGERQLYMMLAKMQRYGHYDWMTDNVNMPNSYNDTWGWDPDDGSFDYLWNNGHISDGNRIPGIVQDSLNTFYNNSTNWWDYMFRVGQATQADLSASGGNDNIRYMIAAGIYNEKGIMLNSKFLRANVLTNLDFKLSPRINAFTRINLAYTDQDAGSMGKVQGLTVDPKSESTLLPGQGSVAEQKALEKLRGSDAIHNQYNVRLNIGFDYSILKNLKFNASAAIDHYLTHINQFTPDYLTSNNLTMAEAQGIGMTMIQSENMLTYNLNFREKHKLELMAGLSWNYNKLETIGGSGQGGPSNQIHYVGNSWPIIRPNEYGEYEALQRFNTNHEVQAMLSYYGRVAYNYDRKYLLEMTLRSDGSSVFGKDVRWGTFPSVAAGWSFSEEAFFKDLWWLSFGKLRASWGKSGQKFAEAYLAQGIMTESNTFLGTSGLMPAILANNKLTWEKSDQYDIGLDLHLFNYRVRLALDYYYKYSSALLMQTSVPGSFFLTDKMWNNGSAISNQGIEMELEADIINSKEWKWTMGFNLSRNWNLFKKSFNGMDIHDGQNSKILGRPIYGIYTYQDEGIVQNESEIPYYYNEFGKKKPLSFRNENYPLRVGGRKIKDQNMDGIIDEADQIYAGSTLPSLYGGLSSSVSWKGFKLDVLMNYVINRKMMNMVKGAAFSFMASPSVVMDDPYAKTFWEKPGDYTEYPSLEFADAGYIGQFDGNIDSRIENVNFLRLKQLTLSYTLPTKLFKGMVKNFRVFVTGENLFLITNYSGLDPEVVNPYTGQDLGDQYPLSRKFTFGLNFNF